MGQSHGISGIATGLLVLPLLPVGGLQLATGVAVAAGAALLPDIDQPQSSIAHTFFLPGKVIAKFVGDITGGHRHATHSLLGLLAFAALAALGAYTTTGREIILFLTLASGMHALAGERLGRLTLPIAFGLCWVLGQHTNPRVLVTAVAVGVAAHIIGDCLTTGGCPLLWPLPQRLGIPILGNTGGGPEILLRFLLVVAIAALIYRQVVPQWSS